MISVWKREMATFRSHPLEMRTLLTSNILYALMLPIIEIFISAYVMRHSQDVTMVMIYQISVFLGVPLPFFLTGWLLRYVKVQRLYAAGMLVTALGMIVLMFLESLTMYQLVAVGFSLGMSFGLYWANRDFLALTTTNDGNRNYYYGIEFFFTTLSFIIIPAIIGSFIGSIESHGLLGGSVALGYKIVASFVLVLSIVSSVMIHRCDFPNPPSTPFVYFKFHRIWNHLLGFSVIQGILSGYIVTAPTMLIMTLVGKEQALGILQAIGGVVSAITLYCIGRISKPCHRIIVLVTGTIVLLLATLPNAIFYNKIGVIIFMLGLTLSRPLLEFATFPIRLLAINTVSEIEKRNEFAYVLNIEFAHVLGRSLGCALFILLAYQFSQTIALRYALVFVALSQFVAIFFGKKVIAGCAEHEASKKKST